MWPFKQPEPSLPVPADIRTRTNPIQVNPSDMVRVDHAKYRLDAINRYLDQTEVIARSKIQEFLAEARGLGIMLLNASVITEEEYEATIAKIKSRL
jgi:hypothetical protein